MSNDRKYDLAITDREEFAVAAAFAAAFQVTGSKRLAFRVAAQIVFDGFPWETDLQVRTVTVAILRKCRADQLVRRPS